MQRFCFQALLNLGLLSPPLGKPGQNHHGNAPASLLILLTNWVTQEPVVKEALTVMGSSEYRVSGAGQGIQGKWQKSRTAHLIGADNIEKVAELKQQTIDHVKIISESGF